MKLKNRMLVIDYIINVLDFTLEDVEEIGIKKIVDALSERQLKDLKRYIEKEGKK